MKLKIGNTVSWESAAGSLTGTVKSIELSENAKYETVPWISIEYINKYQRTQVTTLCGTHANLRMMQVSVIS